MCSGGSEKGGMPASAAFYQKSDDNQDRESRKPLLQPPAGQET